MNNKQLLIYSDPSALADAVAQHIVDRARTAVDAHGHFTIGLSGGSTPRAVYERLARPALSDQMPWSKTYVFWSDERAVPRDDERSNYRMVDEALLKHVPLPKEHIKPILTQEHDLEAAAQHYARVVQCFVPGSPPRFDLLLLGMGPDGHTLSLFPHSPALDAGDALVVATPVASQPPHVRRISFTTRLANAAAEALMLVAGADKAAMVRAVLEGPAQPDQLPAQRISLTNGMLTWMLDQAAAQELQQTYE
jgi:6-phosphogluconolactonase